MIKISVIAPVYNVSKYIEESLNSILDQSFQEPYEIIIVNDCTQDNSIEIIKKVAKEHHRGLFVRIIEHNINRGQSAARNTGLKESEGEYIFFFDSDDIMKPNALELLYNQAIKSDADFVCGETQIVRENTSRIEYSNVYKKNGECLIGNQLIFEKRVTGDWRLIPWNKLIKKTFLTENNLSFYEGIYYEDLLWSVEVALHATKIAFIPEATYTYKMHGNSTSSSMSEKHINSFLIEMRELYNIIVSQNLFEKYGEIVLRLFESNRKLVIDWTIPKVSKDTGKMIIKELQQYKFKSLTETWKSKALNTKLKLTTTAFYLGRFGYYYIKLLSNGGKLFR